MGNEEQEIYEAFAGPTAKTDGLFDEAIAAMRKYEKPVEEIPLTWSMWPWDRCQSVTRLYSTFIRCDLTRKHRTPLCAAERGMETARWSSVVTWTHGEEYTRPQPQCSMNSSQAMLAMGLGSALFLLAAFGLVELIRWVVNL